MSINNDNDSTLDCTIKENNISKVDFDISKENEEFNLMKNKIEEQNHIIEELQTNIDNLDKTTDENDAFIKRLLKD
jgi:methyl-accepting chemotaxis protein